MPHARKHAETRTRERRHRVAFEAARLIALGGIRDYHQATLKAAHKLGIRDDASLPRNAEIEQQLREYQRLFQRVDQPQELRRRREAAAKAMSFFDRFQPRLVGAVLDGTADAHSAVCLQLFSDDGGEIARFLDDQRIPAEAQTRRLRLDRERSEDFPVWLFVADGVPFDLTVLPLALLRQAPLGAIDEKPMRRASLATLQELMAQDEIAGFEAL